ncbi:MAG: M24 family metallopeptidase [Bacteroidales bacterium]|nr:M24 family metallopeptidase [Bacteroidales bacterium]
MKSRILTCYLVLLQISLFGQIPQEVFETRRNTLMAKISNGIAVLGAASDEETNRHEYHQDALFRYFTGINQSGIIVLINPTGVYKYSVFLPEQSLIARIYGGSQLSPSELKQTYKADTVYSLRMFSDIMKKTVKPGVTIYRDPSNRFSESILASLAKDVRQNKGSMVDIRPITDEMRLIKDASEIECLRKAIDITCKALKDAYTVCKPGMYEYEMEATIEYRFRKEGSPMPGYRSIVGSGPNATVLHYDQNTRLMQEGDLLLMDVGAEWEGYSADVTRTIPVSWTFTKEQEEIYQLVLKAEEEAIKYMVPGRGVLECHHRAADVICDGLYKLGLMTDPESLWQRKFYIIYRVNHWLGLDVHDVGSYGPTSEDYRTYMFNKEVKGRPFVPGMVSTIEPGLYFRADGLQQLREIAGNLATDKEITDFLEKVGPVYEKYKNIGVRIEDDVLITPNGNEVLSSCVPK